MSEQNEKKWYVIRAISGKEKKVKDVKIQPQNIITNIF